MTRIRAYGHPISESSKTELPVAGLNGSLRAIGDITGSGYRWGVGCTDNIVTICDEASFNRQGTYILCPVGGRIEMEYAE